jgi:hypothetical protein
LKEVKVNNPSISKSILDDKEIMKEIEVIFERGNEKLMASLEEIRTEQVRTQTTTDQHYFHFHHRSNSHCILFSLQCPLCSLLIPTE